MPAEHTKQLKAKGLLTKKGGFIGSGQNEIFNRKFFR